MSNIDCWGTEEDIAECDFGKWGQGTSNHAKDVPKQYQYHTLCTTMYNKHHYKRGNYSYSK
jgi:hypothetical protein